MEETIFSMGDMSIEETPVNEEIQNVTKIYYYLDDSPTPYVSVVHASAAVVTLADFKKVFTNRGYKYFRKELDKDIGCEVKVEIIDEQSRLKKSANGLFELFLLSIPGSTCGTLTRHSGTLPRKSSKTGGIYMGLEAGGRNKMQRRRSLDGLDNLSVPPSVSASSRATVVSRRAGEHLAELYTSTSEDPYRYDENSCLSITGSSAYDTLAYNHGAQRSRRRKPRKERYRKAYVPSTISSITESSMTSLSLPQILEVHLALSANKYLGISVVNVDGAIIVNEIMQDGAVAQDGRITVGDQIICVNNTSFEDLSVDQSVKLLREVAAAKKPLSLFVAKRRSLNEDSQAPDTITSLGADSTMPLDISLWVQTAVQCNEIRQRNGLRPDDTSELTFEEGTMGPSGETDDEEEQRLYMERRNGAPVPRIGQDDADRRRENERNELLAPVAFSGDGAPLRLSMTMDPTIIVRAMARPGSGLHVKDRQWLKLPVPMSFIGQELVDWLHEHVEDISDRKAARQFAATLLHNKLIRHVVSKLTFNEKCYYVFEESIVGKVGADSTQTSSGTMREATTEVTYLGSPGGGRGRMPTQHMTALQDHTQQTWPISPITVFSTTRMGGRRRECESPVTNDYASMVNVESVMSRPVLGTMATVISRAPPPNTPLCGSTLLNPPHPSPAETEFEDDDRRKILNNRQ